MCSEAAFDNRNFFSLARQPPVGNGLLIHEVSDHAPQSVGLLWTNDQLVADLNLTTHITARDKHPCPWWDSNPQSQEGERPQTYALDRAATGTGLLII